jgi:hypothetical protein
MNVGLDPVVFGLNAGLPDGLFSYKNPILWRAYNRKCGDITYVTV